MPSRSDGGRKNYETASAYRVLIAWEIISNYDIVRVISLRSTKLTGAIFQGWAYVAIPARFR
jgi:hypothetical protein